MGALPHNQLLKNWGPSLSLDLDVGNMELEPEPVTPTKTSGDKGKAKEDSLKTPTKGSARVLDQQATPINQRGTASQAVSDGFAALT